MLPRKTRIQHKKDKLYEMDTRIQIIGYDTAIIQRIKLVQNEQKHDS